MYNKQQFFIVIFFMSFFFVPAVYSADLKNDLDTKSRQLNKMKDDITRKKAEKDRLSKEEQNVAKELKKISASINKTEKQIKNIDSKINTTEAKISSASSRYSSAGSEKIRYFENIKKESVLYNKNKIVYMHMSPLDMYMRWASLTAKNNLYKKAKSDEETAQNDITSYSIEKARLSKLKNEQNKLHQQNIKLRKNKNELLKTTSGKRIQTENEIEKMNDMAVALQELVNKLTIQSKKTHPITSAKSNTTTRRNNLPWPVDGEIVLNYGKNPHPDPKIKTTIISDGIKIKAKNNAIIKAVDDGVVLFSGFFQTYGKMVVIDHKGIYYSFYCQLNEIYVKAGEEVKRGDTLAGLGSGKDSVLYFQIMQYNVTENPLLWLKPR